MVQPATGGSSRAATSAEKSRWRKPAMASSTSPNGRLIVQQVVTQDDQSERYTSFQVKRRDNGNVVLSAAKLEKIIHFSVHGRAGLIFDCWLPDSQHIAVIRRDGSSSGPEYYRFVINVNTGNVLRFNGWIAPSRKAAIVPDKEYNLDDGILAGIDAVGMPNRNGTRKWYVAQIPKGFLPYRFANASKKLITGAGAWWESGMPVGSDSPASYIGDKYVITKATSWFRFTSFVLSDFADKGVDDGSLEPSGIRLFQPKKISDSPVVEFSSDSKWALCNGNYIPKKELSGNRTSPRTYLISMTTGKIRALPGTQAHFVN